MSGIELQFVTLQFLKMKVMTPVF